MSHTHARFAFGAGRHDAQDAQPYGIGQGFEPLGEVGRGPSDRGLTSFGSGLYGTAERQALPASPGTRTLSRMAGLLAAKLSFAYLLSIPV